MENTAQRIGESADNIRRRLRTDEFTDYKGTAMPLRSLIAALTLLAATALLPVAVHAESPASPTHPLRIWVMHNEVGAKIEPVTAQAITAFIQNKRVQDNIIIENSVNNLLMDDALDEAYPLANYVMGQNKFLAEIADFQRTYAHDGPITVEFIRWNDAFSKISNIAAQNITNAPDVIQIGSTWVATFADQGVVVDVSDHFDTDNFFPPSVASARMFGKKDLFAVPWFVDTRVLYYWKKDITSPSQLATWEDFSSTCKASANSRRGSFIGFPNTISWDLLHNLAPWLWAAGGDILEPHLLGPIHRHRVVLDRHEHGVLHRDTAASQASNAVAIVTLVWINATWTVTEGRPTLRRKKSVSGTVAADSRAANTTRAMMHRFFTMVS